jgi:inosine-uridine nucleoside N-ribohydrolase
MWKELKTNIWCSAKHFRLSWDEHKGDVDRVLADYKGAWLMHDTDGDGYKDIIVHDEVTGLPLIDPLLYSQVQSVRNYVTIE